MSDERVLKIILHKLREQYEFARQECGGCEVDEGFSTLKNSICNELIENNYRDFNVLKFIQDYR